MPSRAVRQADRRWASLSPVLEAEQGRGVDLLDVPMVPGPARGWPATRMAWDFPRILEFDLPSGPVLGHGPALDLAGLYPVRLLVVANTTVDLLDRAALASSERMDLGPQVDRATTADPVLALGREAIRRGVGSRAKVHLDQMALASSGRMGLVLPTDRAMIADPALVLEVMPRVAGTRAKVLLDRAALASSGRMGHVPRTDLARIADRVREPTARAHPAVEGRVFHRVTSRLVAG